MSLLWIVMSLAFFLVVFCMVSLILLQEGKGGGLTGNAGSMDAVMGARNPLRRFTAYFFVAFLLLVIGLNYYFYVNSESRQVLGNWNVEETVAHPALPTLLDDAAKAAAGSATDTAKKAVDAAGDAAQAAVVDAAKSTGDLAKSAVDTANTAAKATEDTAKAAAQKGAETAKSAAEAVVDAAKPAPETAKPAEK